MAIRVPIISEFDDAGLQKAAREFGNLETISKKAQYGIEKAAAPAALALGGLAVAAGSAYKAFAEDAASAEKLATTLENVTGASDAQIKSVERFLDAQSKAAAIADDELRPALDRLVRGTGDVTKAQDLLSLALDISAGTGKDLQDVSHALSQAFSGNVGALEELDPALRTAIERGEGADKLFGRLATTFKDQAAKHAETAAGKMEGLAVQMDDLKESIGEAVAPLIEKLLPGFQGITDWISNNTGLVIGIGAAIAGIAASIVIANGALTAWNVITGITAALNTLLATSFSALWVATGVGIILAIIAAVVLLNEKFHFLGPVLEALKIAFEEFWSFVSPILELFSTGIQKAIEIFMVGFSFAIDAVKGYFQIWWKVVSGIIGLFTKGWEEAGDYILDIFKGIAQTVVNAFIKAVNVIIGLINMAIRAYNKLPFSDISPIQKIKPINLFDTEVTGPRLEEPIMNRSGLNVTVNVSGSVTSEQDLLESIRKGLVDAQRNGSQLVYSNVL